LIRVASARIGRATREQQDAIAAVVLAEQNCTAADESLERAQSTVSAAQHDMAKTPGIEQVRLWRDVAVERCGEAQLYLTDCHEVLDEARNNLKIANAALTKLNLQHDQLMDRKKRIVKNTLGIQETLTDDDRNAQATRTTFGVALVESREGMIL
jgi:hypothetical protein